MSQSIIQAAVTMNQLQKKMDTIGHNLANSQTNGYKTRKSEFSSLLFQQINNLSDPENARGRLTPDGVRVGTGAMAASMNNNLKTGAIRETQRALDTALLDENLFFQIQVTENGVEETRYTRDGAFYLSPVNNNESLMLVSSDGNPILGENGPIVIQEGFDNITIREDGEIIVERDGEPETAGQLAVVRAVRPRLLEATGNNLFRLPDLAELGFEFGEVIQAADPNENLIQSKALEQSNVDVAEEMTDLMTTQRAYQMNARTLTMGDQMMGLVNQLRS